MGRFSDESLRNMNKQTQEFFDLPLKEKKRWAQKPGSLEGYGQAFVTSEEQKLEWNDMIFLKALPIEDRNLEIWPENPPKFRMNYYPPCPQPEIVTGLNPHVDIAGFALLLDCGDTPGLQVLKDDHWIFVEPLDGAIVVTWGRSQRY
ncbi:hypothetical protein NC652_022737 [Populus alba x Populus x berolinensis]|nr:hypothetical protein NC652_022737 [Populus alba x Populus x berolinensis]